jgi:hypothetical protein
MSKSRNARARNQQRQPTKTAKPVKPKPSANGRTVKELIADATLELSEDQQTAPVASAPDTTTTAELRKDWEDVQRLRAAAMQREVQAEEAHAQAERRVKQLDEREQALASEEQDRAAQQQALDARGDQLDDRESTLAATEQALDERERGLDEREQARSAHENGLAQRERTLTREQAELALAHELLTEERGLFDARLEQRTAARHEWFTAEVTAHEQRLAQARADRERLEARLRAAEDGARAIGGRAPTEVLAELDTLREERRALQDELIRRPPAEQAGRVEELTRRNEALLDELASVRRAKGDIEIELDQLRTHVGAQQLAEDQIEALQGTIAGYRAALEEEKQHFADLVARQQASPPFERMAAMDADPRLTEKPQSLSQPESLAVFVADVRARIAAQPQKNDEHLYYAERDLRLFLAGLASSQLQILQGLSGTGKTSLPIALATAIDGGYTVVEVQAGWRDRQDLIGHYNTFERRYDETPFIQALYKAQCPAYADRPYFIVLDEMNLSHPEQYFTSLLSSITRAQQEIPLTNVALSPTPRLLRDGRILTIPPNVWFVGTANHDETTKEFADKTHDRAHVQELSVRPAPFASTEPEPQDPVSFEALQELFGTAEEDPDYARAAQIARSYLHDELAETFAERFEVAWGNRLDPQINRFIPVLLAAGGEVGEGVDHLLATKILRKVRNRHDIQLEDLDVLEERIVESWSQLGDMSEPGLSLAILEREKRRLSGGLG